MKTSVFFKTACFEDPNGSLKWCNEKDSVVHIGCDAVFSVVRTLAIDFCRGFSHVEFADFGLTRPFDWHPLPDVETFTFKLFKLLHAFVLSSVAANRDGSLGKKTTYCILYHFFIILSIVYNKNMNILYCGDQGIARGVLVSILSLLKNGQKRYDSAKKQMVEDNELNLPVYHIYIMTVKYEGVLPFEPKTADFLDELVKKHNPKNFVKLIDASDIFKANLPEKNMGTYFTPCAMLRLYMDKVPELRKCDRVLYLDYDVVARGSIARFYNMDLDGIEAAGVLDIYGKNFYHYHGLLNFDYMNSGVMLFNMEECLKTGMFEKAVLLCAKKWMMLPDQAALNKAIIHRRLVSRKYNEQEERPRSDTVLHHFSNNFKFWPYFRVQKVKPFEIDKIHQVLKIHEYDDILEEYNRLKDEL